MFENMDQSKDGLVTIAEMRKALNNAGQDYTTKDIQRLIKKVDKNGDGRLAWEEFLEMMKPTYKSDETVKRVEGKEATSEEYDEAMQAFKMFDKNNDGIINLEELKTAMKALNLETDPEKVEELFKDLDKDKSGNIDYIEFVNLLGI